MQPVLLIKAAACSLRVQSNQPVTAQRYVWHTRSLNTHLLPTISPQSTTSDLDLQYQLSFDQFFMSLTSLSLWISPRSSESEVAVVNSTWWVVSQPPERCRATTQQKHVNNMRVCVCVCVCVLVCVSVLHDAMSHFERSFVYKDSVKVSISAKGAGELAASVLLYFWFCSCSFCSCSRTSCSTSATVVNLNVKKS